MSAHEHGLPAPRVLRFVPPKAWPLAAFVGLGAVTAVDPRAGIALTGVALLITAAVVRGGTFWWDLLLLALGGSLVLGYSFANIGFAGAIPVPLADLILAVLVVRAVAVRRAIRDSFTPFALAAGFLALATVRLALDVGEWGREAVRDFTLPLETLFMLVGFWAYARYGMARWTRGLAWIFVVLLLYLMLYPWREQVAAASPLVGLQRPVPLVGSYASAGTAAAAALFFFALVRPFGRWSYVVAAAFLPFLALVQSRGLYLAVPATGVLLGLLATYRTAGRVRSALTATVAIGALLLALFLPFSPTGRLAPVSPAFAGAQLKTVLGAEGPGSGSIDKRLDWWRDVIQEVDRKPLGWVVGLGLGPDLAGGFKLDNDTLVRKPHNDYLELGARLGVLGLLLFVGAVLTALARIVSAARRAPDREARMLWFIVATAVVHLLVAATQPLLAFPWGTIPLFALLGAGLAIAELRDRAAA
jgi:O-antigen ligase